MNTATATAAPAPLLRVERLKKHYTAPQRWLTPRKPPIQAVDGVSFTVTRGETLSLVGESGCGKTTTAKSVLRLVEPSSGSVQLDGEELLGLSAHAMRLRRRDLQIIFQDPYASLSPRLTAGEIVAEPLRNFGMHSRAERAERVQWLFGKVGLRPEAVKKYPHEFSGGQRQRLGIARALALNPKLIVCDEPVSALDVSVQAQVVNLLMDLQAEFGIAYLFVAHDLAVVRHISHRVAVMYLGQIVELADRDALFSAPLHPYTEILLSAVPVPDPRTPARRLLLQGDPPSPANPPAGCRFHTRCPLAQAVCKEQAPELAGRPSASGGSHQVACHFR
ncbi:ATP-binding cassette domain-containing protein [Cupriavidus basilensis]|uniref:ATP-binding cassette domain-containing protein n=1 Tax=Cupriavidus basilensis TaxID=68895 RepID=A0ABT6AYJ5_9BURK|nr:oligopeptide/dipeptide ABC transporter ATP-binding protein [Cupriavidus basilensis]MDF3837694.1 ATP-binding cassette domain-containing protein [Cupriavidus basilensis]